MSHGSAGIIATPRSYASEVLADAPLWADLLAQTSGLVMDGDYSGGNHNTGVIDAGVTFTTAPASAPGFKRAWQLAGPNAMGGSLAAASWMAPPAGSGPITGLTAEAWVYLTAYSANQTVVMARSDVNGALLIGNKAWAIQVLPTGAVTGRLWTSPGNTGSYASAAGVVPLNTPCHIVLTHDGTTIRCRVNKVQVATNGLAGDPVTFAQNTKPLTLGKDSVGASPSYTFNGKLWAPAYYGYALSSTRADAHYDAGMAIA